MVAGGLLLAFLARREWARVRAWVWTASVAAGLFGIFLLWRWLNHHTLLPNTFYAKADQAGFLLHLQDHVVSVLLPYRSTQLFAASTLLLLAFWRWRWLGALVILPLLAATTLMPVFKGADWMRDHRFATPLFALCHLVFSMTVVAASILGMQPWPTTCSEPARTCPVACPTWPDSHLGLPQPQAHG